MTDGYRRRAGELDAADPLAGYRDRFVIPDPDLVYLDGNSLGRLPVATRDRLRAVVDEEWGRDLIGGWDRWLDLGREAGDVIAGLVGAVPGEVILSDSTSINVYKLAWAALDARPGRDEIVTDDDNFPTDRYVLDGLARQRGGRLRSVPTDLDAGVDLAGVTGALGPRTALVCLSHVAYRSGAVAGLAGITAAAHEAGALTLWDLCHSVGALPVGLAEHGVDLAVGCTYKHLNGGPGSPAFLYVRRDLQDRLRQPVQGWFGQADQFGMGTAYRPAPGLDKFLVGTPPILSGYAALEGARLSAQAGVDAIAAKCRALGTFAIELADAWLTGYGFAVATPRPEPSRGGHVTLRHPQAWQYCQALRSVGVVTDFRTPHRLRLGLPALYTRFADVYAGLAALREVAATGTHELFPAVHSRIT
jgi:kynureninase